MFLLYLYESHNFIFLKDPLENVTNSIAQMKKLGLRVKWVAQDH